MKTLFGPVPSRRYGRSLGIDLVPMKTCCYDCLFCQLGLTPETTLARRDYVSLDLVFDELSQWLAKGEAVDILTLCGSGEPTLHAHFGEVLRWIKAHTDKPSLLMSNGGLFGDPNVRRDAALADRVKISCHFWDEASFRAIVRPHTDLHFEDIFRGWLDFRDHFTGALDVEFFVLPGFNDTPEQLNAAMAYIAQLAPTSVTVNTAHRPPAYGLVKTVSSERLTQLQALFSTIAPAESASTSLPSEPYTEEALLALARRHPLTPQQFARYFGVDVQTIETALQRHASADPYAARALQPR